MPESFKKKIIRNKPFKNAKGQYNFDLNTNLGVYPYIDDKFLDKDLYSINTGDEINEAILREAETIPIENNSYFIIDKLRIANAGVSHDLNHVRFYAYIIDGDTLGSAANEASYTTLNTFHNNDGTGKNSRFYYKNYGDEGTGWPSGGLTLLENASMFENLFSGGFEYLEPTSTTDYYDESSLGGSLGNLEPPENKEIYIIVKLEGDADRWFGTDDRDSRFHVFTIPLDDIYGAEITEPVEYNFTYGDAHTAVGGGGGAGAETPAFKVTNLDIRVFQGTVEIEPTDNILPYADYLDFPNFISNDNYEGIVEARPNRVIDWEVTNLNSTNHDFNFYPASEFTVNVDNTVDLQSYYEDGDERFKASSPITVDLSFKIGKYIESGEIINYTTEDTDQKKIKFKFFVIDWDDFNNNINGWEAVFNKWPKDVDEFIDKRQDNLYKFGQISHSGNSTDGWTLSDDNSEKVKNTYTSPGLKTIKAVIFSYVDDTDGVRFQPVRWKLVTIRCYLDNAKVHMEDFSDIGGPDFVTLPWPNRTPVISGISQDSQYINSIKNVLSSGKLSEVDIIDSSTLLRARDNDELGDYLGYTDFEQTRVFNKPYSMAELLMIDLIPPSEEGLCCIEVGNNPDPYPNCEPSWVYHDTMLGYSSGKCMGGLDDQYIGSGTSCSSNADCRSSGNFYPHTDDTYWDLDGDGIGGTNTFPTESCVGMIFINDNMGFSDPDDYHKDKRDNCIIELNTQELEGDIIRDSSGNGNKGILIGDYKIDKPSKNIPIRRRSAPKISETDSENGAI